MADNSNVAQIQSLRTIAFGAISGTYAAVGAKFSVPLRKFRLINNTNGDLIVTTDTSADQFFIPAGSFVLYDLDATSPVNEGFRLRGYTQFYVKQSTAPSSKDLWIEGIA